MTVSTSTNSVVYRGNGAATQFAVPFKILDEDHLVVRRRVFTTGEVEYTYVGTDYSYSGIGADSGTLTLAGTALDDDYELVIERIVPYTQDLDIVNAGGFYPETVEEQLDIIVMGIQQLADLAGRSLVVPVGEDVVELPKSADRAGKYIAFDAEGDPVASVGTGNDSALRTDLAASTGATLMGFLAAGANAVLRNVRNKLRGWIDAEDYGYVADANATGTAGTDNAAALNAALVAAAGRPVRLPAGRARFLSTVSWVTGPGHSVGMRLIGEGRDITELFFDFNGDAAISADGSTALQYRYQKGGCIKGMSLHAVTGRSIDNAIQTVGWLHAELDDLYINGNDGCFDTGIGVPEVGGFTNPDAYASIHWRLSHVEVRKCRIGVAGRNGLGCSTWHLDKCTIEENNEHGVFTTGDGWQITGGSCSFNGADGVAGYGIAGDGATLAVPLTNIKVEYVELDGNLSAGLYLKYCLMPEIRFNRFNSRVLGGFNRSETHVVIDPSFPVYGGKFQGNYHRVDTAENEQTEAAFVDPITLYDAGDGGAANVFGLEIDGFFKAMVLAVVGDITNASNTVTGVAPDVDANYIGQKIIAAGIPAGTTVTAVAAGQFTMSANATATTADLAIQIEHPVTDLTNAFKNPHNRNHVKGEAGKDRNADRTRFVFLASSVADFTNALTKPTISPSTMGWSDTYNTTTKTWTMPATGCLLFRFSGVLKGWADGDTIQIRTYQNGLLVDTWDDRKRDAAIVNTDKYAFMCFLPLNVSKDDTFYFEIICTGANKTVNLQNWLFMEIV